MGYLSYKDGFKTWSYNNYYKDYIKQEALTRVIKRPFDYWIISLS